MTISVERGVTSKEMKKKRRIQEKQRRKQTIDKTEFGLVVQNSPFFSESETENNLGPWKSLLTAVQTDNAPPQRGGHTALWSNQQQHLLQHWEKAKRGACGVSVLPSTAYSSASGRRSGGNKPEEERTKKKDTERGFVSKGEKKVFFFSIFN